ncbi:hypothetical protein CPB84DRAFT_1817684 [Gymnopilus junonius]|uniref:CxC6 like cysteine cluster associated with KDZ domain-containing protein n=1 Tax=Gymnopilus junonius TaxID=109634 RepID=A0A9P5NAV0_GYMJU|nr:hypothetical protein CPB84DRAFT_1817684 [Gymnopilus junonius]
MHASASAYTQFWNDYPAAVLGADGNSAVPSLVGEYAAQSAHETTQARQQARIRAERIGNNDEMNVDYDDVNMIVLDGIVMGPVHCAHLGCTKDVRNARGGAFCYDHERAFKDWCHIRDCPNDNITGTLACQRHQSAWRKHKLEHSQSSYAGMRRLLQRPEENLPWQPRTERSNQPHDNDDDDEPPPRSHYFNSSRFYCVETICAPCGVVIAWTKFDKSESPTKILNFLKSVYPTQDSRPNYICIDKACKVLRTSIANRSWDTWQQTSCFIVDSYHYINHHTTDYLCRKWCNPASLDGSAPNLVKVAKNKEGNDYLQRAFNTQACSS